MAMTLNIDNPHLEKQLLQFVREQKQNLEEITVEALELFMERFNKKEKFHYTKRDPKKYMHKIEYNDENDENLSDVKPYAHIEDSAKYIHDLRRKRNR
ncbi:MAG: hypothetical protein IE889_04325 [Campylobacterales bacterium]|nr:hypothetical protein [Campylobacterales bacterium]